MAKTSSVQQRYDARVSPLEEMYRQYFQQVNEGDVKPFNIENFRIDLPQPNQDKVIRTYTTYGAYEQPIGLIEC